MTTAAPVLSDLHTLFFDRTSNHPWRKGCERAIHLQTSLRGYVKRSKMPQLRGV